MSEGPVRLNGVRGRLARWLLGSPSLRHNGVSVDAYSAPAWHLAVFPSTKGRPFDADNLATASDHSFLSDEVFVRARAAAESRWAGSAGRDISWRLHVALWSVATALDLHGSGDLVELGTGRGYMAAGICSAHGGRFAGRELVLVDRFRTEVPSLGDAATGPATPFCYTDDADEVIRHFARFPFVRVERSELPEDAASVRTGAICWIHVDLNDPVVEVASLQALRERMLPNTILLFDDTGNPGYSAAVSAHRALVHEWGAELLSLPTGQAMAIIR